MDSLTPPEKIALLEGIERRAKARDPRIIQVMASLAGEFDVVMVARSNGLLAADIRPLVRVSIHVIAEQNGRRESGSAGGGARADYGFFDTQRIDQWVDEAVDQALLNLDSRPAPAGPMTVVMGRAGLACCFTKPLVTASKGTLIAKDPLRFLDALVSGWLLRVLRWLMMEHLVDDAAHSIWMMRARPRSAPP